ncbi:EF-hand domain-containing protein [Maioricimonas rarisocia]|uniref:EF-hand domain-containing protein n=1 Tax=Maioricimonas rarisocia TaxID=2528026 RepID=UPI0011A63E08|nr:EF-hand domain-containing protein [Maioricimonas rarisocia]
MIQRLALAWLLVFAASNLVIAQDASTVDVEPEDAGDPVAGLVRTLHERIQSAQTFPQSVEEWEATPPEGLPASVPLATERWDRNDDGEIDGSELLRGLEIAFGVRRPDGGLARREDGRIFYGRLFDSIDRNSDRRLSAAEYNAWRQSAAEETPALDEVDANENGVVNLPEIDRAELFLVDPADEFERWDADGSGSLSAQELASGARDHERNIARHTLPGFDTDNNGEIELSEFVASPLAELNRAWNDPVRDLDGDGRASLEEFYTQAILYQSGLAAVFFDKLDTDDDGYLSTDEFALHLDLEQISSTVAFRYLDTNGDQILTSREMFPQRASENQSPVYPWTDSIIAAADRNGNASIDFNEYEASPDLARAIVDERWARDVERDYLNRDADGDGRLSIEEFVASVGTGSRPRLARDATVLDADGDGHLSLGEYLCMPFLGQPLRRHQVFDPLFQECEAAISAMEQSQADQDANGDGQLQREEWNAAFEDAWFADRFEAFDADNDGAVSPDEIRSGWETTYGVRVGGVLLRRPTGHQFNWRYVMKGWDRSRDGVISREEFARVASRDKYVGSREFSALDANGDGQLTVDELASDERFLWIDVLHTFLGLDADLNGELSLKELELKLPVWQKPYLPMIFPGFDLDANEQLSFSEFRGCPFGNSVLAWDQLRPGVTTDGQITLAEFHPLDEWAFLGMTKLFFDRMDQDNDGALELLELDVDWGPIAPEIVLTSLDANSDGKLTELEAFGAVERRSGVALPDGMDAFADFDADGDGTIALDEVADPEALATAVRSEHWLRQTVLPEWTGRDSDQDGRLTETEFLAGLPKANADSSRYDFVLFDSDADEQLTLAEFAALRSYDRGLPYFAVTDPVVELVNELLKSALKEGASEASVAEVSRVISPEHPVLSVGRIGRWDINRDGGLSHEELLSALERVFGVRAQTGERIRTRDGHVLYARSMRAWDRSGNRIVERAEFIKGVGKPTSAGTFDAADANGDHQLSVEEARAVPFLWKDVVVEFRRFDTNRDAVISPEELTAGARPWEAKTAQLLFPAFDVDQNGSLSFREFRMTPLANPFAFWERVRHDKDYDGQLSIEEFHADESDWLIGLSGLFAARLDTDGDGALSSEEIEFRIDIRHAPAAVVFATLDVDGNGTLSLDEVLNKEKRAKHSSGHLNKIEDAFYAADRDQDALLSQEEFESPSHDIAAYASGRPVKKARGGRFPAGAAPAGGPAAVGSGATNWKFYGLVGANILILLVFAWVVLKPWGA